MYKKVDFHCHFIADTNRRYLGSAQEQDGYPTPAWSLNKHLSVMDMLGIEYALLSLSSPAMHQGDGREAADLVRQSNEEAGTLMAGAPDRIGFLASLPMPEVVFSVSEIDYALDSLHAKGFTLITNVRGVYLGDPVLDPVMEKLNSRGAIVTIHPTTPSAVPENVNQTLPTPALEFLFDTTRTVINMVTNGAFARYPDIKWIIPHAGAFLACASDRYARHMRFLKPISDDYQIDIFRDLRNCYYDMAGASEPKLLELALRITDEDHILYGSDWPHTPIGGCEALAKALENTDKITPEGKEKLFRKNGYALLQ